MQSLKIGVNETNMDNKFILRERIFIQFTTLTVCNFCRFVDTRLSILSNSKYYYYVIIHIVNIDLIYKIPVEDKYNFKKI